MHTTTVFHPSARRSLRRLARAVPLAALLLVGACASVEPKGPPVRSVERVDVERYLGRWYEIASFPMVFQSRCVSDTTAEYSKRPDGDIAVRNRCRTADGSFTEATAHAWAVEGANNAQLKVSFFKPFRADYWVIGLDPDYKWAVVGQPSRKYLWLLSRTPTLSAQDRARALETATRQGYDLAPLRDTPQGGGAR